MNTKIFDVYKTSTGLYVSNSICEEYQVGNKNVQKDLKGTNCYQVTEEDLNTIKVKSSESLVPNIVTIFDLQLVLSFTVYRDINHNNKLYIPNSTCIKYEIAPSSKRTINNTTCGNVTEEDIQKIEDITKNEKIALKRKYEDVSLPDEMQPTNNLVLYYYDTDENKYYIDRFLYELLLKNNIEIEATPRIIYNKNCYSITEKQLKEAENTLSFRGIEQIINKIAPLKMDYEKMNKTIEESQNRIYSRVHIEEPAKQEETNIEPLKVDFEQMNKKIEESQNRIYSKSHIEGTINIEESKVDSIIIYKDNRTNKLYAPFQTSDQPETTTIMNKPCYEITVEDLNEIKDKRIVIASIYLVEKKEYDIIVCNNKGQLFVSKNILDDLGFYIENPHKILVNSEIYEEITEDDVDLIKSKESDHCHINIIMKQIAPKRG